MAEQKESEQKSCGMPTRAAVASYAGGGICAAVVLWRTVMEAHGVAISGRTTLCCRPGATVLPTVPQHRAAAAARGVPVW